MLSMSSGDGRIVDPIDREPWPAGLGLVLLGAAIEAVVIALGG